MQPGRLFAQIQAPEGTLSVWRTGALYGTFSGRYLDLDHKAKFHLDTSLVVVGGFVSDTAGAAGSPGDCVTDATTFAQWFTDKLGENLSVHHTITLTRDGSGVYEYLDDTFYPADGLLFGNEGDAHNHNFTYAIEAVLVYHACGGPTTRAADERADNSRRSAELRARRRRGHDSRCR